MGKMTTVIAVMEVGSCVTGLGGGIGKRKTTIVISGTRAGIHATPGEGGIGKGMTMMTMIVSVTVFRIIVCTPKKGPPTNL